MARPWKHPDSGVYWFRKGVPDSLRSLVGKREEKVSLQTKDPVEARFRHGKVAAEVAARWASLTVEIRSLTEREAHEIAGVCHDLYFQKHADNPSEGWWNPEIGGTLWRRPIFHDIASLLSEETEEAIICSERRRELETWCLNEARGLAKHRGFNLNEVGIAVLGRAIGAAMQSASLRLHCFLSGDYTPSVAAAAPPRTPPTESTKKVASEVLLSKLFDGWRREKGPTDKTAYTWKRVLDRLSAHLGHADAARLTADDMVAWKGALVEAGLKNKTIRDGNLAPVRAILQWGVDNRLLEANAAERVSVGVKSKTSEKIRGYNEEEARMLLLATLNEENTLKRWVPWICAYTGARLAEICQLRTEDFRQEEGVWFLRLAAEAGSLKNDNSERAIPVHSALIEAGLLNFVRKVKSGPLFHDLKPDRFGNRGGNGTKVLSRWVRDQGLVDLRISPNHSWRHRFKTLGRRHGLAADIVDAITGHGKKTVADAYGEFDLSAMQREIEKIPRLSL